MRNHEKQIQKFCKDLDKKTSKPITVKDKLLHDYETLNNPEVMKEPSF